MTKKSSESKEKLLTKMLSIIRKNPGIISSLVYYFGLKNDF